MWRDRVTTSATVGGLAVIVVSVAQWNGIVAGILGGAFVVAVAELEGRKR